MEILIAVGIGLVVFGALVLLRFPDRPGGRIGWHGMEVSSVGAGLPLIALGVAAVALGGSGAVGGGGGEEEAESDSGSEVSEPGPIGPPPGCFAEYLAEIPSERTRGLQLGTSDVEVIGPTEAKRGSVGVWLHDEEKLIGGVVLDWFPDSRTFKVRSVVGPECEPAEAYEPRELIEAHGNLEAELGGTRYVLGTRTTDVDLSFDFALG